jgi:hypothetical protein
LVLKNNYKDEFEVAVKVIGIMKIIGNWPLQPRHIDVLAWLATNDLNKEKMAKALDSSIPTISNSLTALRKKGFVLDNGIHPIFKKNYSKIKIGVYLGTQENTDKVGGGESSGEVRATPGDN